MLQEVVYVKHSGFDLASNSSLTGCKSEVSLSGYIQNDLVIESATSFGRCQLRMLVYSHFHSRLIAMHSCLLENLISEINDIII